MTIRTLLLLAAVACGVFTAIIGFGFDIFDLDRQDIREDYNGWLAVTIVFIAAALLPWRGHWFGRGPA